MGLAFSTAPLWGHSREPRGPYMAERFESEDGLPDNSATAVAQTPDGFLWFGTFEGLVRYDGVRFKVHNRVNTPELPSASIVNVHCDRAGALWCSTYEGLARLENGRWRAFTKESGWTADYVRTFSEAPDGALYLAAFDGSLWKLVGDDLEVLPTPPSDRRESFGHCDPEGRFWIARRGFVGFLNGGQWQAVGPQPEPTEGSLGGGPARDGGFWVVVGDRLRKLRGTNVVEERRLSERPRAFWSLHELMDGELWIASYRDGLYVVAREGAVRHATQIGPASGYPDNAVRCVFEDREGNTWVGTSGSGLIRLTRRVFSAYSLTEGLSEPNVKSISLDPTGRLWLGTYGGGVFRTVEDRVEKVALPAPAPPSAYVESILADRTGQIWISLLGTGSPVIRLRGDDAKPVSIAGAGGTQRQSRSALFEDSRGCIWIGGGERLVRYEGEEAASFPVPMVRALAEGPDDGRVWAASARGLFRLDGGGFEEVRDFAGRSYAEILCLRPTAGGGMWFGTAGQGLFYRRADGRTQRVGLAQGLPVEHVSAIVEDGLGWLWLASNHGVSRVPQSHLEAVAEGRQSRLTGRIFTTADGLPSNQCPTATQPIAIKTDDGRLWFATQKGVAVVDPCRVSGNPWPPPVVITAATFLDRRQQTRPLSAGPNEPGEASAGSTDIAVEFAVLTFANPEKVQCRSRLERAGSLLSEHYGSARAVAFELLPPGEYTLRITAANGDGVWNEEGATLRFRVQPFLWERLGFRITVGLLLLGLAGGASGYVVHHHRLTDQLALVERARVAAEAHAAAAERLQESETRRIRAEDEAELRRQREALARDVHDGIGGLAANLSMMASQARHLADPVARAVQLDAIEALAREELVEVRSLMNTLEAIDDNCGSLAAQFRRYGRLILEPRGIALHVDCRTPDACACGSPVPFLVLFRIYKEAIANVARHSQARSVRVGLDCAPEGLRLVVADDGVGLPPQPRPGRGLRNMERRAAELGGRMERSSPPGLRLSFEIPWMDGRTRPCSTAGTAPSPGCPL